jgi:hypothetical protein
VSVNPKLIRAIPAESEGFEIVFPRDRSFSGAGDISVAKLVQTEDRVLVTSASDFSRLNFKPGDWKSQSPNITSENGLPARRYCGRGWSLFPGHIRYPVNPLAG